MPEKPRPGDGRLTCSVSPALHFLSAGLRSGKTQSDWSSGHHLIDLCVFVGLERFVEILEIPQKQRLYPSDLPVSEV